jgi:hypothetical protein
VTLLTAHKIFIASAALMFIYSAAVELWNRPSGGVSALLQGIGFAAAAIGLSIYLRWRCVQPPTSRAPR